MAIDTIYVQTEKVTHVVVTNDTGADMSQYDFDVVGPWAAVADRDVDNGEIGSFHVEEGIQLQSDNLKNGEDTFATPNQAVYFNITTKEFGDTLTDNDYLVGYLIKVKTTAGMIVFEKLRYALLIIT
jgi:hypothetical protein